MNLLKNFLSSIPIICGIWVINEYNLTNDMAAGTFIGSWILGALIYAVFSQFENKD